MSKIIIKQVTKVFKIGKNPEQDKERMFKWVCAWMKKNKFQGSRVITGNIVIKKESVIGKVKLDNKAYLRYISKKN